MSFAIVVSAKSPDLILVLDIARHTMTELNLEQAWAFSNDLSKAVLELAETTEARLAAQPDTPSNVVPITRKEKAA
jgi:hypothetical protein